MLVLDKPLRQKWEKLNWWTPDKENISNEAIIEYILKYGNNKDYQRLLKLNQNHTDKEKIKQIYIDKIRKTDPNFKFQKLLDFIFDIK